MPETQQHLEGPRKRIDEIDQQILDLLVERNATVQDVIRTKIEKQLPVFVPSREREKTEAFTRKARERGLDPDWAEDFLRMIMAASRASQSQQQFPRSTEEPKHVLYVGGEGGMGSLYKRITEQSGHIAYSIDKGNWHELEQMAPVLDLVIVTVPINITEAVINRLSGKIQEHTILADFTSNKSAPIQAMIHAHTGPVVGLHPMHGPDVHNLSKQLMVYCPARHSEQAGWFINQCELWGMRIIEADPEKHDHVMHLVQGLRHFVALLHGSFMKHNYLRPADMLDYSSPIYRAELMMTGRIFAQSAELYADIVFANEERRKLLTQFFDHHARLAELVRENDRDGFIQEFEGVTDFFGRFATQALDESSYLINRLADRFA
ncbi:MAG: bifunctional chorismate mutase/prephenate dehydrogenase [Bacteroidota bacterium]